MFKVDGNTIHCSRGDRGGITFKLPIVDVKNNIKYKDVSENIYWYDTKKKKLYDSNYEISEVSIENLNIVFYIFQEGDIITFNIYEKNGYKKEPLVSKSINTTPLIDNVYVELNEQDTSFGEPVNKPTIFWYDVTLNDDLTAICYDEEGAKEFIEYPARGGSDNV